MQPNPLLELAAELLREVFKFQQPADAVVSDIFSRASRARVRAIGKHVLAETTYGVLRQRSAVRAPRSVRRTGARERRLAIIGWHGDAEAALQAALSPAGDCNGSSRLVAIDQFGTGAAALRHNLPEWLAECATELARVTISGRW